MIWAAGDGATFSGTWACVLQGGGGSELGISCGGVGITAAGGGAMMGRGCIWRSNSDAAFEELLDRRKRSRSRSWSLSRLGGGPSPSSAIRDMYWKSKIMLRNAITPTFSQV